MTAPRPDYDEEARKLFALLNLAPSGAASDASSKLHSYHNLDAVWKHPTSGGQVFIGNATASSQRGILQRNNITHIVNCTSDLPNAFEGDGKVAYYRFDIYKFFSVLDLRTNRGVFEFFHPVFQWIDEAVNSGQSVLIHCLAGAHRAGTTGVAYVMHAADLEHQTAISACKRCRPVVDPIGREQLVIYGDLLIYPLVMTNIAMVAPWP
ncbi:unnamed protein product [Cladocopium goreaui]|uniref:protein-tyrosine-phosphatase n=1 Tax=Cladocopium goreaui TaxID=2562237 RepID=A0A9P1CYZ4_9DINO|nr:unnamed protein product [Cladocopium goreaui]